MSHRIHGLIIAGVELALAVIPYSLVQYLVRVLLSMGLPPPHQSCQHPHASWRSIVRTHCV